jgi:hypothetical protein
MIVTATGRVSSRLRTTARASAEHHAAPKPSLTSAVLLALALAVPFADSFAQDATKGAPRPAVNCRASIEPILARQREIEPTYSKAEFGGQKADACKLAKAYLTTLDQLSATLKALPPGCTPANAGLPLQYVSREKIAWLGKAQRNCPLDAGPVRQQHRIIKVQ